MSEESAVVIDRGLCRLLRSAELTLVEGLQLQPFEIPPELAELEGNLDGKPLTLSTRRYSGARFSSFTVAKLAAAQRLRSLTVIGLPPPGAPWPVLGIDIIALRGQISLLAIDLAPTDIGFWRSHCSAALAELTAEIAPSIVSRKRPEFTAESFSPLALIAGVRAGQEASVLAAAEHFLHRVMRMASAPSPASDASAARVALERRTRWLEAERRNRKEHNALSRMFGAAISARYLEDFLFGANPGETSC